MKYFYIALFSYLVIISLVAIIATIKDKKAAENNRWRIKEFSLILISFLGGAVAMLVTMKKIRHKTKHAKFMVGIPLIILLHIVVLASIIYLVYKKNGSLEILLPY